MQRGPRSKSTITDSPQDIKALKFILKFIEKLKEGEGEQQRQSQCLFISGIADQLIKEPLSFQGIAKILYQAVELIVAIEANFIDLNFNYKPKN